MKKLIKKMLIRLLSRDVVFAFMFGGRQPQFNQIKMYGDFAPEMQIGLYDFSGKLIKSGKVVWE